MDIRTQTIYEPLVVLAILISIGTHFSFLRIAITALVFGIAYLIVKIGKMGLGDAELLALMCSAFGGATTLSAMVIGSVMALAFAMVRMVLHRTRRALIPLAPFLAIGVSGSFLIALSFTLFH